MLEFNLYDRYTELANELSENVIDLYHFITSYLSRHKNVGLIICLCDNCIIFKRINCTKEIDNPQYPDLTLDFNDYPQGTIQYVSTRLMQEILGKSSITYKEGKNCIAITSKFLNYPIYVCLFYNNIDIMCYMLKEETSTFIDYDKLFEDNEYNVLEKQNGPLLRRRKLKKNLNAQLDTIKEYLEENN